MCDIDTAANLTAVISIKCVIDVHVYIVESFCHVIASSYYERAKGWGIVGKGRVAAATTT